MYEVRADRMQGRLISDWEVSLEGEGKLLSFNARHLENRYRAPEFKIEGDSIYAEFAKLVTVSWAAPWNDDPPDGSEGDEELFGQVVHRPFYVNEPWVRSWDERVIASFAQNYGPLYEHEAGPITERLYEWVQPALVMNLAMKLAAVLKKGASCQELSGFVDFGLLSSMTGAGIDITMAAGARPAGRYADLLSLTQPEYSRIFKSKQIPALRVSPLWLNPGDRFMGEGTDFYEKERTRFGRAGEKPCPLLNVRLVDERVEREGPVLESMPVGIFDDVDGDSRGMFDLAVQELLHYLVDLHTRNIRFAWTEGIYAPRFTCLLDRIWHSFALSLSTAQLGICERCGDVLVSTSGRKHCDPCHGKVRQERGYTNDLATKRIPAICAEAADPEDAYDRLLSFMLSKGRITHRNIYRFEEKWRKLIADEFAKME